MPSNTFDVTSRHVIARHVDGGAGLRRTRGITTDADARMDSRYHLDLPSPAVLESLGVGCGVGRGCGVEAAENQKRIKEK